MTIKQVWTTSDGVSFATLEDAEAWERKHASAPAPSTEYRIIARPTFNIALTDDDNLTPEEVINQLHYSSFRADPEEYDEDPDAARDYAAYDMGFSDSCVSQEIVSCVRRTSPSTGWERVDLDLNALSLSTSLASPSASSSQEASPDLAVDIRDVSLEQTPDTPAPASPLHPSQAPDFMTAFLASHPNAGTQCSDPADPAYARLAATVEAALASRAFAPLCQVSTPAISDYAIRSADPSDPAPLHDSASVHFSVTPTATPGDPCALDAADLLSDAAALVRALQTRFNNVWIRAISGSAALLELPSAKAAEKGPTKASAAGDAQDATPEGTLGTTPQGPQEHKGYAFVQAIDVVLAVE